MVHVLLSASLWRLILDTHFYRDVAGTLELERQRKPLSSHEWLAQPEQHDVTATGFELNLAGRWHLDRLDLFHAHHLALTDVSVQLSFTGTRRLYPYEPIRLVAWVLEHEIDRAGWSSGRHCPRPGLSDGYCRAHLVVGVILIRCDCGQARRAENEGGDQTKQH